MGDVVDLTLIQGDKRAITPFPFIGNYRVVIDLIDSLAVNMGEDPLRLRRRVMFDLMYEQLSHGMPPDFLEQRVKEMSRSM